MSLFNDKLADFREPPPPFNGRNSLKKNKKKSDRTTLPEKFPFVLKQLQLFHLWKILIRQMNETLVWQYKLQEY